MHLLKKAAKAVGVSALLGVGDGSGDVQTPSTSAASPEYLDVLFECAPRPLTKHPRCAAKTASVQIVNALQA